MGRQADASPDEIERVSVGDCPIIGERAILGPLGTPLTMAQLPPPDTQRWVARRKAEVIAAIHGGLLSRSAACHRYGISEEELKIWEHAIVCAGVPGLRVTRVQVYRPVFEAKRAEMLG